MMIALLARRLTKIVKSSNRQIVKINVYTATPSILSMIRSAGSSQIWNSFLNLELFNAHYCTFHIHRINGDTPRLRLP